MHDRGVVHPGADVDVDHLDDLGDDLPGVGQNLQDHLEIYLQHACPEPVSLYPALKLWNQP